MTSTQTLHFAMMCQHSNGGFYSALTLIDALRDHVQIRPWSLLGKPYPGHAELLLERGLELRIAEPTAQVGTGEHVFFYMNEYPMHFRNFSKQWQQQLKSAASVQFAFNRTLGALPLETWLAEHVDQLYFQDHAMQYEWQGLVKHNDLKSIPSLILPPPVQLGPYLAIQRDKFSATKSLVIGRLAGDGDVGEDTIELYLKLAKKHPQCEFWFMPSPAKLREALGDHRQFRFLEPNEISVNTFLAATDIFLLTYQDKVPIPGPRSLVEAMAAGCAPVVVNRDGPRARIIHGESGYCADNHDDFYTYTDRLIQDQGLRLRIGQAARKRAQSFKLENWTDQILKTLKV